MKHCIFESGIYSKFFIIPGVAILYLIFIGVGRGGQGGKCPPTFFNGGGHRPPTFLELYINCRMVAPNCCARPVA